MAETLIDLDEISAAIAEVESVTTEAPKVVFAGKTYTLPAAMPMGAFMRMAAKSRRVKQAQSKGEDPDADAGMESLDAMYGLMEALFRERVDEFLADNPSEDHIEAILNGLGQVYGADLPKVSESQDSSATTMEQSSQTSSETTD